MKTVEIIYQKTIHDENKITNYSWYCAAVKHQSHNFGVAIHDDDDYDQTYLSKRPKLTSKAVRVMHNSILKHLFPIGHQVDRKQVSSTTNTANHCLMLAKQSR